MMIRVAFAILTAGVVLADPSPLDSGYCQLVVHYSQWCIGVEGRTTIVANMPCTSRNTRFRLFPDGSLRLLGRENRCLKRGWGDYLVYCKCDGAYTFSPKYIAGAPSPKTYKIYSTNPSYKSYFIDIAGTSPKDYSDVLLWKYSENYYHSDHYLDIKNCYKLVFPLQSINTKWIPFTKENNVNNKITFSGDKLNVHSVRMPCSGGGFRLSYTIGYFEILKSNKRYKGSLSCKSADNTLDGEKKYDFSFVERYCVDGLVQYDVAKTSETFEVYVKGTPIFKTSLTENGGQCLKDINRVTTFVYDEMPKNYHLGIDSKSSLETESKSNSV